MQFSLATIEDVPALCDLLADLFALEQEFTPDREAQARGLSVIINNPNLGVVLTARKKARPVAMVSLLFTVSTALGEPVALLEDMVVEAFYRNRGLGSKLLNFAVQNAKARGIKRLTLLTDADNKDAHSIYSQHDFVRSDMVVFRKAL